MKKYLLLLIFSLLLSGCAVSSTLYLRDVEVQGPVTPPPVQVTTTEQVGKITISPKFYIPNKHQYGGEVNPSPTRYFDTVQNFNKKENFRYITPDYYFGFDFDFPMGKKSSFVGNVNYSKGNISDLYGGSLGLSFFSLGDYGAFRTSFGLIVQQYAYDASTIAVIDMAYAKDEVVFYHDINKNTGITLYFNLLYNSDFKNIPFNFYLGLSYFGQEMLDFEAVNYEDLVYTVFWPFSPAIETDSRGEFTMHCINITPGIFFKVSDFGRLVVGANIINNLQLGDDEKFKFMNILPTVKFDFFF